MLRYYVKMFEIVTRTVKLFGLGEYRRYAQLIASIMTLQSAAVSVPLSFAGGGITGSGSTEHAKAPSDGSKVASTDSSSWGIGGGGETMLQQDMSIMRAEMIGIFNRIFPFSFSFLFL